MDGGIDMVYSKHFGWQLQERLQQHLRADHDGELPVGQAVIIPTYGGTSSPPKNPDASENEGKVIKYLISAPTMRVPQNVADTTNAYLAFRAVLRAVQQHNRSSTDDNKISSVLCPGLGTAVGGMPYKRCAKQVNT
jgi:O-acetyl-ADP-ribose deacetylase (regulator of RNase III)